MNEDTKTAWMKKPKTTMTNLTPNPNKWVEEFTVLYKDDDTYLESLLAYLRVLVETVEARAYQTGKDAVTHEDDDEK